MLLRRSSLASSCSRIFSALVSRLPRWRPWAWLNRLPLQPAGLTAAPSGSPNRKPVRLDMEQLERRETPNDVMGLLQGGFGWAGLTLLGRFDTPNTVFFRGWTSPAGPALLPSDGSSLAGRSDNSSLGVGAAPWELPYSDASLAAWNSAPTSGGTSTSSPGAAAAASTGEPQTPGPLSERFGDGALTDPWGGPNFTNPFGDPLGSNKPKDNGGGAGGGGGVSPLNGGSGASNPVGGGGSVNNGGGGVMPLSSGANASLGSNSMLAAGNGFSAAASIPTGMTLSAAGAAANASLGAIPNAYLYNAISATNGAAYTSSDAHLGGLLAGNIENGGSTGSASPGAATDSAITIPSGATDSGSTASQAALQAAYGQIPLTFEVNQGQADGAVQFLAHGQGYGLYLTSGGQALLGFTRPAAASSGDSTTDPTSPQADATNYITDVIGLQLVGANANAAAVGVNELETKTNYFIGNDPSHWQTNVANYAQVEYQQIYQGVNLVYYGNSQGQLETDFDVAAGADPSAIQFTVQGAQSLALDAQGNLVITTESGGTLTEQAPTLYQEVNGVRQTVSGAYVLEANGQVGFAVGSYDDSRSLTIDPVFVYATYVGGSNGDLGANIFVDGSGNAYISGVTGSTNFPTTAGAYQSALSGTRANLFISKLNANGTGLVYSTYLGGSQGSSTASGGMAVDGSGEVYVTGYTFSSNFPITSGAYQTVLHGSFTPTNLFITKLNSTGSGLVYSTFLGVGGEAGGAIALDGSGNAYVVGQTVASNFSVTGGAFQTAYGGGSSDGFLSELNSSGTALVYSTYLGGSGTDTAVNVQVNSSGDAYVTGSTTGSSFPTTSGAYQTNFLGSSDAFVTEVNSSGSGLIFSTLLGATSRGGALVLGSSGNVYVTGLTEASFPTTNGAYQTAFRGVNSSNAFVTELNSSGSSLIYSTYLGGSGTAFSATEAGYGIVVDGSGNAYVTGSTNSSNFPTTVDGYKGYAGATTGFVTEFNSTGTSLVYSNFLGAGLGYGVFVDGSGATYVTGTATALPTTTGGAYQTANAGGSDAFVVKLAPWLTAYPLNDDTLQTSGVVVGDAQAFPQNGDLSTSVPLQLAVSTNSDCGCGDMLVYNSNTAAHQSIVEAVFQPDSSYGVPTQIQAQLTWNGSVGSWATFSTSGHSAGDAYVIDMQSNSTVSTAGFYSWTIEVKATLSNGVTVDGKYSGVEFANILSTPFGNGWTLGSLDHLVIGSGAAAGQIAYVYGQGGYRLFTSNGNGTYTDPANDFGTLTSATAGGVTTYTYALNGTTETFTQAGLLDHTTYPDGKATTYVYTSGNLSKVLKPDGAVSTFVYTGSLISSIQEPGGRVVNLTHSTNKLTGVTQSDGSLYTYSYDANFRMLTDAHAPLLATYAYSATTSMISTVDLGGGETYTFSPAWAQGLAPSAAGNLTQTVGVVTDASGHAVTYQYDSHGRTTQTTTPDAAAQSQSLDSAGNVVVSTDGRGNATSYTYDAFGDVLTETDPNGAVTSYQYNATFHEVTQMIDPRGNITTYVYDGQGELTQTTDALGNVTTQVWSGGLLQNVIDPNGNIITYTYNASLQMTAETTAAGTTSYTYGLAGNLYTVTDPLGRVTTNTYDGRNRLATQTTPDGGVTSYAYDGAGDLKTMTDPLGHVTSYGYDGRGEQISVTEAYGTAAARTATNAYNALGQLLSTTDPNGNVTSYIYDAVGRQTAMIEAYGTGLQRTTTTVYDAAGNVLSTTDPNGHVTSYAYDGLNREIEEIDGYGTSIASTTTMIYDAAGNLLSETTGQSTTAAYSHLSTTSYLYDALNRQTEVIQAYGTSAAATMQTAYDKAGNVLSTTDPDGNVTSYAYDSLNRKIEGIDAYGTSIAGTTTMIYDAAGNLLSETTGQSTTVAYAHASTISFAYDVLNRQTKVIQGYGTSAAATVQTAYDKASNVLSTTDPDGNVTSYAYDALNQRTQEIDAYGTSIASTTTMIYDSAGNLLSETTGQSTTAAYAHASTVSYAYNALNQQTEEIDAYGTSIASTTTMIYDSAGNLLSETTGQSTTAAYANASTTSFAYDALNRRIAEINAYGVVGVQETTTMIYDAAGDTVQRVDAAGNTTSYGYDALGRQITMQTPAGGTATTVYDPAGNVLAQIDQLGHATSYAYDALNRKVTETDADNNVTSYAYDAASDQVSLTDADNNTTTMAYDALSRQISETDPLGHTSTAAYDAAGNLLSTTDRNARLETYSYDAMNRQIGATWIVSSVVVNVQAFSYDAAGNQLTAADNNGAYTMTYDALNRTTSEQEPFGQALTFAYDAANNRTLVQDSQSGVTTSVYNALNLLTTRELGGSGITPLREDLTYTPLNQIATETRYTDLAGTQLAGTSSYVYDAAGRLTNLTQTYANGSVLASYVYNYDQASRLTSEIDNGVTTSYTNDAANQLTQAGAATYGYDATGNRTNTGYSTGPDNQLLGDGTYTYSYDNEGNQLSKRNGTDITTYNYDNQNHLTGMVQTVGGVLTAQATFVYDVYGNRVETDEYTQSAGVTTITRNAYDGKNAWVDLNGSNTLTMRRVFLDGQDQMLARVDSSGNLAWYGTDHLGSVQVIINAAGTLVLDRIVYDGYGNIITESNASSGDEYKYAGYRWDGVVEYYQAGRRWYDAVNGRMIQQDPIQFAAGYPNLYEYVGNNPTNFVDPSGQIKVTTLTKNPTTKDGSYDVKWRFELSKKAAEDGYIVQQVTFEYDYTTDTGVRTVGKDVYWEAWFVKKGQTIDTWDWQGNYTDRAEKPPIPDSHGKIVQSGVIKFFFKKTTGNLGDPGAQPPVEPDPATGFGGKNAAEMALELPSTTKPPLWWKNNSDNGEPTATRSVATEWGLTPLCGPKLDRITVTPK